MVYCWYYYCVELRFYGEAGTFSPGMSSLQRGGHALGCATPPRVARLGSGGADGVRREAPVGSHREV